jgi:two-component system cell cycle sensor histidine kinase/response regulator CckA
MENNPRSRFDQRRYWVTFFVFISLIIIVGGFLLYRSEVGRIEKEKYGEIKAIGDLKTGQLVQWRKERLADVDSAAKRPAVKRGVEDLIRSPHASRSREGAEKLLKAELTHGMYVDALLLAMNGDVLFSAGSPPGPADTAFLEAMQVGSGSLGAVLSRLYRSQDGKIYIDAIAPVSDVNGRPSAMLVLRTDAEAFLYPLVQSWPTPSRTAETLLVRKEGSEVLFLNELRHRTKTALTLRYPLTETSIPAVQVVLGKQGVFRGRDYRNQEVLADLRPIPESPWFIVAKVDTAEILAEARYRAGAILLATFLFILLTAAVTAYAYRHRQIGLYKALYRAERELGESHRTFRATLYSIGDAVITTDVAGRVKEMNPVAEQLTGWQEEEARGKPLSEVFHIANEETLAVVENPANRVLRDGVVVGLANHTLLIAKNGVGRPIADSGAPIRNEEGEIVGVVLVFRDQTEEREAEKALIAGRDQLSDAMELAHAVYWAVDVKTDEFIFNDPFYAFYGTTAEREGGYRMTREEYGKRFIHPDDMWIFAEAGEKRRLHREREFVNEIEHRIIRRDGEVRHIVARIRVSSDAEGHAIKYHGSNQDITERKLADEALRKSEEKYRRIVDTASEGIVALDDAFNITFINKRFVEMMGYSAEEMMGQKLFSFVFEGNVSDIFERRKRQSLGKSEQFERRFRRNDGNTQWVQASVTPMMDEEGRLIGSLAMYTDITSRKQAEEERALLESQLVQSQKMEAIGTLAGGVAHDFNNILTAIIGFASVLQMDMDDSDPKTGYVQQILASAQKAANLTQSLLAFSRKQRINLKRQRLNDLVEQTAKLLKRLLTEDVEMKVRLGEQKPAILADSTQIDQILINLTTNARDAMPRGGTLLIETGVVAIDEEFIAHQGYGETGKYALLSVSDTGTGMDENTRERIFEPFFTTKEVGKGTGLGLSSVYGIVRQHNGYIVVDSALNRGTTFQIFFPLAQWKEEGTSPEVSHAQRGSETILVAEDDRGVRTLIADILHRYGYTTIEAVDGQDAFRKFMDNRNIIDLIVIDVVMPRMNGKEVYEEIKRTNPNIKALFVSGYTREVIIDKGVEDTMVDFITKPIALQEFLKKVREILGKDNLTGDRRGSHEPRPR